MSDSTDAPRSRKAPAHWKVRGFKIKKPYPGFPLTPHACGAWQKKVRGKIH